MRRRAAETPTRLRSPSRRGMCSCAGPAGPRDRWWRLVGLLDERCSAGDRQVAANLAQFAAECPTLLDLPEEAESMFIVGQLMARAISAGAVADRLLRVGQLQDGRMPAQYTSLAFTRPCSR